MSSLLLQSRSEELEMGYASRDLNQRPGISAGKVFVITIPSFLWPGPGPGKVGALLSLHRRL
jgi:hypothetical protein